MLVCQRVIYDIPLDQDELAGLIPYEITIQLAVLLFSLHLDLATGQNPDTLVNTQKAGKLAGVFQFVQQWGTPKFTGFCSFPTLYINKYYHISNMLSYVYIYTYNVK